MQMQSVRINILTDSVVTFQSALYRFEGSSSAISMNAYIRERRQECMAGTAVSNFMLNSDCTTLFDYTTILDKTT